jgi:hypothetical protein
MAPFEVLYGRRCRTPLNWLDPGERWFSGLLGQRNRGKSSTDKTQLERSSSSAKKTMWISDADLWSFK